MEDPKLCRPYRAISCASSPRHDHGDLHAARGRIKLSRRGHAARQAGGCAFADVSTGEVCAASFETDAAMHIQNEISRFRPRECVLAPEAMLSRDIRDTLEKAARQPRGARRGAVRPRKRAQGHCKSVRRKTPLELDEMTTLALGALLAYSRTRRAATCRSCACRISSRGPVYGA